MRARLTIASTERSEAERGVAINRGVWGGFPPSVIALVSVLVAACSTPRTQVMVIVVADDTVRAMTGPVFVEVRGGPALTSLGAGRNEVFRPPPALTWPMRIPVIPENNDGTRVFRVEVRALGTDSTSTIAVARAATGFVQGETRMLFVHLTADCIGVSSTCGATQTCARGACSEVVFTPPQSLPMYTENIDAGLPRSDGGGVVEINCTDSMDNDGDDQTDCGDSDCADDAACQGGPEGAPCGATMPCQAALTCAPAPLSVCIRACSTTADCAASTIANAFCASDSAGLGFRFCGGVVCTPSVPGAPAACPTGQRCQIVGGSMDATPQDLEAATFCVASGTGADGVPCSNDLECRDGYNCWFPQSAVTSGVCMPSCYAGSGCATSTQPCVLHVVFNGPQSTQVRVGGNAIGSCGPTCDSELDCPTGALCSPDVGYCTRGHEGEVCFNSGGSCGNNPECVGGGVPVCVTDFTRPWFYCGCPCTTAGSDSSECHDDFSTCAQPTGGTLRCTAGGP